MLKPPVSKFRPDLSARLIDITEKQIPTKPKLIVALCHATPLCHGGVIPPALRAGCLEMCALWGRRPPPNDPLGTATNTYLKCVWLRRDVK